MRARDLALGYGSSVVVRDIDLDIPWGASVAVIGPNGSGKSTFLRALAGLIDPMGGTLEVGPGAVAPVSTAMVLQATEVDRSLPVSVLEAVRIARYPSTGLLGRMSDEDRAAVSDAIARVGLEVLVRRQIHELSGGQRQRVLVAQGLAQGAQILLLDEPFTGLDAVSRDRTFEVVASECELGHSVVLSTHDLGDARDCDLVLVVAGHQVAFGPPGDVLNSKVLAGAFGGQIIRLEDGTVFLDDPHHQHHHADGVPRGTHGVQP